MIRFDRGGTITDQVVENGTVIIQVMDKKIRFQAQGEHRHSDADHNLVVKPGVSHSRQAEKTSTLLLTILRG